MTTPAMVLPRGYIEECIYRYRLRNPEKKIDNDSPKLHAVVRSCIRDALRMDEILNENKKLLSRLAFIFRTTGKIDCTPPKPHYSTNYSSRLQKAARIERDNLDLMGLITSVEPVVPTVKECSKFWNKQLKQVLKKKGHTPFLFTSNERSWMPLPSFSEQTRRDQCSPRAGVFMEFTSSTGRYMGRIEFELFTEKAPTTCKNFLAFISGNGVDGYLNSSFYRILPGYYIKGGDVTNGDGSGEVSIFGKSFPDEENDLHHVEPGLLCTPEDNPGSSDSKFMVTCKPLPSIDSKSVVFGRVILGWEVLNAINACGSAPSGKVITQVFVTGCGKIPNKKRKKRKEKQESEASSQSP